MKRYPQKIVLHEGNVKKAIKEYVKNHIIKDNVKITNVYLKLGRNHDSYEVCFINL